MQNPVVRPEKTQAGRQESKKPYQKPSFRCERVFETQALSCGKIYGTTGECRAHRKAS